jgi:hypothetical protein
MFAPRGVGGRRGDISKQLGASRLGDYCIMLYYSKKPMDYPLHFFFFLLPSLVGQKQEKGRKNTGDVDWMKIVVADHKVVGS